MTRGLSLALTQTGLSRPIGLHSEPDHHEPGPQQSGECHVDSVQTAEFTFLIASASHNLSCDLSEPIRDLIRLPRESDLERPISQTIRARECDPSGSVRRELSWTASHMGADARESRSAPRTPTASPLRGRVQASERRPSTAFHYKVM